MRLLQCSQPTLHRPGRPHPFPDCGLHLVGAQILISLPLFFSGESNAFSQALQRQNRYPVPPYSSLLAPPNRGASLEGQWQERRIKVDTSHASQAQYWRGQRGRNGPLGLVAQAATVLCSSYSSTWKLTLQKQLPHLLPQYKAQVSFPIKGVTLIKRNKEQQQQKLARA